MVLDITIKKAIGKFFKGKREDMEEYLESKNLKSNDYRNDKTNACINCNFTKI
jgi:hypothetical protein